MNPDTKDKLVAFLDDALKKYIELEREARDAHKLLALQKNETPESERDTSFSAWIAGQDENSLAAIRTALQDNGIDVSARLTTGGGILDHLSEGAPDIVVIVGALPDLSADFAADVLRADHPQVARVIIDIDDDGIQRAVLSGPFDASALQRRIGGPEDLADLINHGERRLSELAIGRDFADRFKERHDAFLRRFVAIRQQLSSNQ